MNLQLNEVFSTLPDEELEEAFVASDDVFMTSDVSTTGFNVCMQI